MNRVVKWILTILTGLVTLVGLLIVVAIICAAQVYGLDETACMNLIRFAILAIVAGCFFVYNILDLRHPERVLKRKDTREVKRRTKQIQKEKEQEEFFAQERVRRDEEYRLYSAAKAHMEAEQKQKEQEYLEKEKDLANDDIAEILKPKEGGPLYVGMTVFYVLSGIFGFGVIMAFMTRDELTRRFQVYFVAEFVMWFFLLLAFSFLTATVLRLNYKAGLLQVLVKTKRGRLYLCHIMPQYLQVSTSSSKITKILENHEVGEVNKELHKRAMEYRESEEFKEYLVDCVHRKKTTSAERTMFIYLQDYRVRKGIIYDTFYYLDEETDKKSKVAVCKDLSSRIGRERVF